jgi:probable phosphoglycerate mutase
MNNTDQQFPLVYLVRHGETAWTITGQHTGLTDLPLTESGEHNARQLGKQLQGLAFSRILTSPLRRAAQTCWLAGFKTDASVDEDLVEWNYGIYEGKTSAEIRQQCPSWEIFRDGCPDGETVAKVAMRANRVIDRIRAINGNVLLFSHSHFLHVFAARWLGLEPAAGRYFFLDTATLSIVGYHHNLNDPVIRLWNNCRHKL